MLVLIYEVNYVLVEFVFHSAWDFYNSFCPLNYFDNIFLAPFKGTGTRDLIWLKVEYLDSSWLVGLTDDL